MKCLMSRTLAALLFVVALGWQSSLSCQELHPLITYRVHVDAADFSGFAVAMRIRGAGDTVRIAMQAHPDRYFRYVENLTACLT